MKTVKYCFPAFFLSCLSFIGCVNQSFHEAQKFRIISARRYCLLEAVFSSGRFLQEDCDTPNMNTSSSSAQHDVTAAESSMIKSKTSIHQELDVLYPRLQRDALSHQTHWQLLDIIGGQDALFLLFLFSRAVVIIAPRPQYHITLAAMVLVARPYSATHALKSSFSHSNEWLNSIAPVPPHRSPWNANPVLKGLFAGSGNGAMSHPYFAQSVVDLAKLPANDINLLYIGTASYDIRRYRDIQTSAFAKLGCVINSLDVANQSPLLLDIEEAVLNAHVILVSGGNTLYAMDRWRALGLDGLLKDAAIRGTVLTGGSAGCICWFDGGHSDSMDPDTYRSPMLVQYQQDNPNAPNSTLKTLVEGKKIIGNSQEGSVKQWNYIRVEGLGIIPGLVCPHYDRIQSNGVPRMTDFDSMMSRHSLELGLGIDHFAALEINGEDFRVLSIPGAQGSVPQGEFRGTDDTSLIPGAWIKYVGDDGRVYSKVCPTSGKVEDLIQMLKDPKKHIWLDRRVEACRLQNPGPSYDIP